MSTPTDTLPAQPQAIPAIKPRKWRVSPAIRTAVVLGRAEGKPISHIAKQLGIANNTTREIIKDSNIDQQLALGHVGCAMLIPKATQAIEKSLDRGDGSLGIRLLEGLGVLGENARKGPQPEQFHLSQAINIMFKQQSPQTQADTTQPVIEVNAAPADK